MTDELSGQFQRGCFGSAQGDKTDFTDLEREYVELGAAYGGLSIRPDDARVRVVVGRMGSGKTLQLKRLQAFTSSRDNDYYSADFRPASIDLNTVHVIEFSQLFGAEALTENWKLLWRAAILRSVVSHLLKEKELRDRLPPDLLREIREDYKSLLRISPTGRGRSIANQAAEIIGQFEQSDNALRYITNPGWEDVEHAVYDALSHCPPVFFYVDAIDDEWKAAPMYWLRAQKGLFYCVMALMRTRLMNRLHVVIAIRDLVLSSVYQSEHQPRYVGDEHTRILAWNGLAISSFAEAKIDSLVGEEHLLKPAEHQALVRWTGRSTIKNNARLGNPTSSLREPIGQYIFRHSRYVPRDIVQIGNALCRQVHLAKERGQRALPERTIGLTLSRVARLEAEAQLAHCANQIASDVMPAGAVRHQYEDLYVGSEEYKVNAWTDDLIDVLRPLKSDRLTASEVDMLNVRAHQSFSDTISLPDVLWQNGLLGAELEDYQGRKRPYFYNLEEASQFTLPQSADYLIHPILIDKLPHIKGHGPPIVPYPIQSSNRLSS